MADYQLELRQIVDYPRCRIYREFMQTLIADRSIRTGGCSGLFYYVVLCSYANFRTSYRRIDGISYTVYPGEWICSITDITMASSSAALMGKLMWEQPPFDMVCFYNIIYHIILHKSIEISPSQSRCARQLPRRGELYRTDWQITKKLPLSGELDANEVSRLRGSSFSVFRRDILSEILLAQGL